MRSASASSARVDAGQRLQLRAAAAASSCAAPGQLRRGSSGASASAPAPAAALQRVEAAQALAGGEQLLVLALVGCEGVDLAQLELEQVELALALAGELAQLLEPLPRARACSRERRAQAAQARGLLGAAEPVEDLELGAGEGQLAVLVLAVEGAAAPPMSRSSPTVAERPFEVGARAPVGADPAGQHELLRRRR